jgi:cytochrome c biogenesis protein CcdA
MNIALTSLFLGLLTTTSPCILPLYPGFLAYLSGQADWGRQKYFLGLFVLAGVLTMMLALGGILHTIYDGLTTLVVYCSFYQMHIGYPCIETLQLEEILTYRLH